MLPLRTRFHGKRVELALLRIATYSCVCGIFFMVGMEIGRFQQQGMRVENRESKIITGNEDPKWHDLQGENQPGNIPEPKPKPGEMGKPFKPKDLSENEKKLLKEGWDNNAFNQYVSDLISLDRSLPDVRDPKCKEHNRYLPNLPRTSVIVCFHNEAWSTLLRSVHSIMNRSPPELLHEVILVDDCSTQDHLKSQLEQYLKRFPKVKIVRSPQRVGLIRARILGANAATGKVLTFLDSHIEVTTGWLPPLLDRIGRNLTTVVCPIIDVIDDDTLEYHHNSNPPESVVHNIGIFDWSLTFNWASMPERQRKQYKDTSLPFDSPTMAGGLFSINRRYFDYLGRYDPEFDIWGGENLELSFKTWMCGGRLEMIPCSHVGHIFRKRSPYEWREGVNVIQKNLVRLAKVWTDDYAKHYYNKINNNLGDYGDISDRVELRKRLKCKSFGWYLKNIYPEIFIPDAGFAYGEIRNLGLGGKTCLDSLMDPKGKNESVGVYPCHGLGQNQFWSYTKDYEIRREDMCVDYDGAGAAVKSIPCHGQKGNQEWRYDSRTKELRHPNFSKCLTMTTKTILTMEPCQGTEQQSWKLENYREIIPEANIV